MLGPAQRKTGQASSFTYLIKLCVLSRLAALCLEVSELWHLWSRVIESYSPKAELNAFAGRASSCDVICAGIGA